MAVEARAPYRTSYPRFWATVGRRPYRRPPPSADGHEVAPGARPLRVAVVGKGGAGKSVIAGTMARFVARRGNRVLALDTDTVPGLAQSLGATSPPTPPLMEAVEKAEAGCWRLKKGIGPVRAVQRFSTVAPDGVRVLEVGNQPPDDSRAITPAVQAFYQVIHGLPEAWALRTWAMIGDHPAGPRQTAHDWAPYADALIVVAEPTWKSALTARRLSALATTRGQAVLTVANKVRDAAAVRRLEELLHAPVAVAVPEDEAVVATDRLGAPLIDEAPASPATRAIEDLVEGLPTGALRAVASGSYAISST